MPTQPEHVETFNALLCRYRDDDDDDPGEVHRVSFAEVARRAKAPVGGDDRPDTLPVQILRYMIKNLGLTVESIGDLTQINADEAEEEIHCYIVTEGVAVSYASQGAWILFER